MDENKISSGRIDEAAYQIFSYLPFVKTTYGIKTKDSYLTRLQSELYSSKAALLAALEAQEI